MYQLPDPQFSEDCFPMVSTSIFAVILTFRSRVLEESAKLEIQLDNNVEPL